MRLTGLLTKVTLLSVILAYCVIGVGAFTRLTNAGLGCPDWPACYGSMIVTHQPQIENFDRVKAQIEMGHRYIAGVLGAIILFVAFLSAAISSDKGRQFLIYAIGLLTLLVYQVLLGMWTVTLKLSPWIVMQHLFAGFAILTLLWVIYLSLRQKINASSNMPTSGAVYAFAWMCFLLLAMQIILGGWTSSNYAGLVYHGISAMHRWSALIVAIAFIILSCFLKTRLKYFLILLLS